MRISVGLETPLLKKLYDSPNAAGVGRLSLGGTAGAAASGGMDKGVAHWYHRLPRMTCLACKCSPRRPTPLPHRYHWFSFHTQNRSYDFGVPEDSGDENQTVVLWVLTLQHLLAARLGGAVNGAVNATSFCALSDAQYQWQRYDQPKKEWACMACTFQNRHNSPYCHQCETPRPIVTLCPSACKCSPRRPTPLPHRCETPRPIVTLCPCLTPLLDGEMLQVSAVNCL
jgi:hypothetical protein